MATINLKLGTKELLDELKGKKTYDAYINELLLGYIGFKLTIETDKMRSKNELV